MNYVVLRKTFIGGEKAEEMVVSAPYADREPAEAEAKRQSRMFASPSHDEQQGIWFGHEPPATVHHFTVENADRASNEPR